MNVGLLLIHAFVGALLVGHGSQKLFGLLGGYGLSGTGEYMASFGLRPGRLFAFAAGAAELAGGLAFALGFATPVAAALIAATMLVAARTDHAGKGLWIFNGGAEYVLTNAALALGLAFNGPGTWSVDHAIGWSLDGTWWGVGAVVAALAGAGGVLALRSLRLRRAAPGALVPAS